MLEKNPDTVKIVFKHLPLRMHQMAEPAALAAIAAQDQGKFWQMHDAIFAMDPKKITKDALTMAAVSIGMDMDKFNKDMNTPATKQKLAKDMADARQADVSGTPTMFINGRRIKNRGGDAIQQMINQELAKAQPAPSN